MRKIKPFIHYHDDTLVVDYLLICKAVEKNFSGSDAVTNENGLNEYVSDSMETFVLSFVSKIVTSGNPREFFNDEYYAFSCEIRSIYADIHCLDSTLWNRDHGRHSLFGSQFSSPLLNDGVDFHDELHGLVLAILGLRLLSEKVKVEYFAEQMVA